MHHTVKIDPPRLMTDAEQRISLRLLSGNFVGDAALRSQIKHALVAGSCSCGCLSVIFEVDKSKAKKAQVSHRVPIEAESTDLDGVKIHFLLHVVDGFLAEVEIFREDSGQLLAPPKAESLQMVLGPLGGQLHPN